MSRCQACEETLPVGTRVRHDPFCPLEEGLFIAEVPSVTHPSNEPMKFMSQEEASRQFGGDYDGQCARCGSSIDFRDCDGCDGEGFTVQEDDGGGEYEEPCDFCQGDGSWPVCLSSYEWCEANPLEAREQVERGTVEWFKIDVPDHFA